MAQALAEAGAEAIALLDIKEELGQTAAAELSTHSKIPVKFYKTDVRDAQANNQTIEKIASDFGSVDILINSAGVVKYVLYMHSLSLSNRPCSTGVLEKTHFYS